MSQDSRENQVRMEDVEGLVPLVLGVRLVNQVYKVKWEKMVSVVNLV